MGTRLVTLAVVLLAPLFVRAEPLAPGRFDPSWNGLEFGATREKVIAFLKERIRLRYEAQIRDTRDVAVQDRLKRARDAEIAAVDSDFVVFDGQPTGWDVSVVRGEFAHRTNESMLHIQEGKDRYYFFFTKDVFYKIVRTTVDQPMASLVEAFSRVYGPPAHVEHQDPKSRSGVRSARWEQGLLGLSIEDKTQLYQCLLVRWGMRAADEAVRAAWEKARSTGQGLSPIVREAAQSQEGPDTINPVDEILGHSPSVDQPAPPPPARPSKKKPKK